MTNQNKSQQTFQKSLLDEIDFKTVDQIHGAVSQISSFCFELKKLCVATLFIALTFIIKFTGENLDSVIFKSSYCMILSFWFLDSVAYYYQVKLRGKMQDKFEEILDRNNGKHITNHNGESIIDKKRTQGSLCKQIFNAGVNHSMWLYLLLTIISSVSHLLFINGMLN